MEGSYNGAVRFFDRHHRQNGTQRRVHVDDVILPKAEDALEMLPQLEPPGEAGLGAIRVYRLAFSNSNYMRLWSRAGNIRRDDINLVSIPTRLAREEVDVLTDPAEVRIIVFGDQRDPQRPRVLYARHRK
jgi:hypothetical protein